MKILQRACWMAAVGAWIVPVVADETYLREGELDPPSVRQAGALECAVDCRDFFTKTVREEDHVVSGINYSAIGWESVAAADPARTVTIIARPGTLANGVFTPLVGAAEIEVMSAREGRGVFDWSVEGVDRRVYQLEHTVRKGGLVDDSETLYGYFSIIVRASQSVVESAVLAEVSQPIAVRQDAEWPWQPMGDITTEGSGVSTASDIPQDAVTATAFAFRGCGTLHYEYGLTGGELSVVVDGETAATCNEPTAGWVARQIPFAAFGMHEVVFSYAADGDGSQACIRNVRWEVPDKGDCTSGGRSDVRVDLRDSGIRSLERSSEVLPFVYSSTNWVGFTTNSAEAVVQIGGKSVARVTIVKLTGDDGADVRQWTELPKTRKELKRAVGEGEIKWYPRKGVWKATFDILDGEDEVHHEETIFDLRDMRTNGLVMFIS